MANKLLRWFALLFAVATALPVLSQSWPDKSIRIIVPFPPGQGADLEIGRAHV